MNKGGEYNMTEQYKSQPTPKKEHRVRNSGLVLGGAALALAVAFGAGRSLPTETAKGDSYSPNPTMGELATPKPSQAAGTPEASTSPEANIENFTVEKLGTFEVMPGDIIAGDVAMSDSKDSAIFPLYDQDTHKASDVEDNTKTALYVEVQAPGVVHAEWGATVSRGMTAEQKAEMLKLQTIAKERAGFTKVDVVVWTGYDSTTDEAGFTAGGEQGSSMPNPSMEPGSNLDGTNKQELINTILDEIHKGNLTADQEYNLMQQLIACLCSCGTPTETPMPTPTPTNEVCVPMNDHFMKSGETYKVSGKEFIVQGDVIIDGVRHYDNSAKTGAIDVVLDGKTHTIKAPYGADVQVFNDCATDANITDTYNHDLEQLKGSDRTLDSKSIKKN